MSSIYFKENKYKRWYDNIITTAISRGWTRKTSPVYTEEHHIIPESLGGSNAKNNLVYLTAREHLVAHLCLARCSIGIAKSKMWNAIWFMCHLKQHDRISSRSYKMIKENVSTENKKFKHTDEWKKWKSESMIEFRKTNPVIIYQHQRDLYANLYKKCYEVTDPSGNISIIENMSKFCRDNNLNKGIMCSIGRGENLFNHYKGWTCKKLN